MRVPGHPNLGRAPRQSAEVLLRRRAPLARLVKRRDLEAVSYLMFTVTLDGGLPGEDAVWWISKGEAWKMAEQAHLMPGSDSAVVAAGAVSGFVGVVRERKDEQQRQDVHGMRVREAAAA